MNRGDRKGYLLIEVIIGLSIFALVTGVVTQGFLTGLKLYGEADDADPNESVVAPMLINRITNKTDLNAPIEIGLGKEKWKVEVKAKNQISSVSQKLYALDIGITKSIDLNGRNIDPPLEKAYHIFRYMP
ncbi:MAG: prepilin-type N-terminal cleavage/methylation domain-containing protein [Puniceicoccales bacterium]|jgi:hypothetical protein|nr:prepilin-type N-terminal cleavage/methylation domain-containing protein [Puniceicoccales bacterium]